MKVINLRNGIQVKSTLHVITPVILMVLREYE